MAKIFSISEVAMHKKPDDLWIIVDEDVYDLTEFQADHPGELFSAVYQGRLAYKRQVDRKVCLPKCCV